MRRLFYIVVLVFLFTFIYAEKGYADCFTKEGRCAKGLCCTCDKRDPVTNNCVGGSKTSYCSSCSSPTVDVIKCGKVECNAATETCCPGGCKSKDVGCGKICTDTEWSPSPDKVCAGKNFTQKSNCGKTREEVGTNQDLCGVCTEIAFYLPKAHEDAKCLANADCAIPNQPEGQFCDVNTGVCKTWKLVELSQVSNLAKTGEPIKFAFTAPNTTKLEVKVNEEVWKMAGMNKKTGKYDFVYSIVSAGTFNIKARYTPQ